MRIHLLSVAFFLSVSLAAQVKQSDVTGIISTLAADSMMGRLAGTVYADKAAAVIAAEFRKGKLLPMAGTDNYYQRFSMLRSETVDAAVSYDSLKADPADILVFAENETINWDNAGAEKIWIPRGQSFGRRIFDLSHQAGDKIIFADSSYRRSLNRFRSFPLQRFAGSGNIVVVLAPAEPGRYGALVHSKIITTAFQNVAAMIPGKRKNEYVVFSGHYDHLGTGKPVEGDSIFNGANDDAAGTTAVITLAKYFRRMKQPERTLLFVAFTAEESGGYGSGYFSRQLNPEQVVAMFNIEMIGTESKWGKNSAYITGYDKSDFGSLLLENLKGSGFNFYPDPYPQQNLFYRSDNATLARLGVPAHTISTSKMDSEKFYHTVGDEVKTLDLGNMTAIIKAIAMSSKGIVDGKQTPRRVQLEKGE